MRLFTVLLFSLFSLTLFANVFKQDVLRLEFINNGEIETIDLNRSYSEVNGKLEVTIKPEKVEIPDLESKGTLNHPIVKWRIDVDAGIVSVISNTSQIPRDIGTKFDIDAGILPNFRIYLSSLIKNKHEIRLLFAPLAYTSEFTPENDILFSDTVFLAGTDTEAFYKFNSYRLSYIFHFNEIGKVQFRAGFTAKIRDAETALTQGNTEESFTNVGFVPLIHLGANIELTKKLILNAEIEGSWAPQGYAVDTGLILSYNFDNGLAIGAGVRLVDGGADVDRVNTFARLGYGFVRVTYTFPYKK